MNRHTLHSAYYSTPAPVNPAAVLRDVREFRSRRFHWPCRDRGIAPGRGNRATRRAYTLAGSRLFYGSGIMGVSARRLFIS